ncbi:hypothetical protein [Tumebacillus lipolyticus]|uniref:Uncharacterized protein n=1 Tax=Tumebacillus lipolyticus TaxID=1280370 RepID=A0ABW5A0G2_9BACL
MMSTELMRLRCIQQSVHRLEIACGELEVLSKGLLQGPPELQHLGIRLQQSLRALETELQTIGDVIHHGNAPPLSQEQLNLGSLVQEALNEISQI